MGNYSQITSPSNAHVKETVKLRDKRQRDKTGMFLIEGFRELTRANAADWSIEKLFFCPHYFLGSNETLLINQIKRGGSQIFEVTPDVFKKISYRDRPDGLMGHAAQRSTSLDDLTLSKGQQPTFILIAEGIEKPGNLGSILRSCDASGVDALIVCDPCTDIFNPNVVRASVGTLFTAELVLSTTSEAIKWLRRNNITIASTTPKTSMLYNEANFAQPIAIAMGTEQHGLSRTWIEAADMKIKIPMKGIADSLNVATAATVMLYEVVRQRS